MKPVPYRVTGTERMSLFENTPTLPLIHAQWPFWGWVKEYILNCGMDKFAIIGS